MPNYILGGWTQSLCATAATSFSHVIYAMVTNLNNLTTGGGWSPATTSPPQNAGEVMWAYGGEGATPSDMPATDNDIDEIIQATETGLTHGHYMSVRANARKPLHMVF